MKRTSHDLLDNPQEGLSPFVGGDLGLFDKGRMLVMKYVWRTFSAWRARWDSSPVGGYRRGRSAAKMWFWVAAALFSASSAQAVCGSESLREDVVVLSVAGLSVALEEALAERTADPQVIEVWTEARRRARGAVLLEVERATGWRLKVVFDRAEESMIELRSGAQIFLSADSVCCDVIPFEDPACHVRATFRVPSKKPQGEIGPPDKANAADVNLSSLRSAGLNAFYRRGRSAAS